MGIKSTTGKNAAFKISEKVITSFISFFITILLARLLSPDEYGLIAMVTVFITIADVLVTCGFGSAIIQNRETQEEDISTILWLNVAISICLYLILFILAPTIAHFYGDNQLKIITRVLGIRVISASIRTVQEAKLSRELMFQRIAVANIGGGVISGGLGVFLAYSGYGVWALVLQNLTYSLVVILSLLKWSKRIFIFKFSLQRAKGMVKFAWKLLVGGLVETIGNELGALIIGKKYSSADLAYYNKGQSFPMMISSYVTNSLATVVYPVMARTQLDLEYLKKLTRKSERITSFVVFPLFFGLFAISDNFISVLLTDKWLDCSVYLRLACLVQFLSVLNYAIQNAVCAIGKSNLKLIMDVARRIVYVSILFLIMNHGVVAIATVQLLVAVFSTVMVVFIANKNLNYSLKEIIIDHLGPFCASFMMAFLVFLLNLTTLSPLLQLVCQICAGIISYIIISRIMHLEGFYYIKQQLLEIFVRKGNDKKF